MHLFMCVYAQVPVGMIPVCFGPTRFESRPAVQRLMDQTCPVKKRRVLSFRSTMPLLPNPTFRPNLLFTNAKIHSLTKPLLSVEAHAFRIRFQRKNKVKSVEFSTFSDFEFHRHVQKLVGVIISNDSHGEARHFATKHAFLRFWC